MSKPRQASMISSQEVPFISVLHEPACFEESMHHIQPGFLKKSLLQRQRFPQSETSLTSTPNVPAYQPSICPTPQAYPDDDRDDGSPLKRTCEVRYNPNKYSSCQEESEGGSSCDRRQQLHTERTVAVGEGKRQSSKLGAGIEEDVCSAKAKVNQRYYNELQHAYKSPKALQKHKKSLTNNFRRDQEAGAAKRRSFEEGSSSQGGITSLKERRDQSRRRANQSISNVEEKLEALSQFNGSERCLISSHPSQRPASISSSEQFQKIEQHILFQSQLDLFKQKVACRKIQRFFRAYLLWMRLSRQSVSGSAKRKRQQEKLQQILAAKVITRGVRAWLQRKRKQALIERSIKLITRLQIWYKGLLFRRRLQSRLHAKSLIFALFQGWKTRRIVNSLAKEIQEFVNCEEHFLKLRHKRSFYLLFENVVNNKLWLSKNQYRLVRLQNLQNTSRNKAQEAITPQKTEIVRSKGELKAAAKRGEKSQDEQRCQKQSDLPGSKRTHSTEGDKNEAKSSIHKSIDSIDHSINIKVNPKQQAPPHTTVLTPMDKANTPVLNKQGKAQGLRFKNVSSRIDCWRTSQTSNVATNCRASARDNSSISMQRKGSQTNIKPITPQPPQAHPQPQLQDTSQVRRSKAVEPLQSKCINQPIGRRTLGNAKHRQTSSVSSSSACIYGSVKNSKHIEKQLEGDIHESADTLPTPQCKDLTDRELEETRQKDPAYEIKKLIGVVNQKTKNRDGLSFAWVNKVSKGGKKPGETSQKYLLPVLSEMLSSVSQLSQENDLAKIEQIVSKHLKFCQQIQLQLAAGKGDMSLAMYQSEQSNTSHLTQSKAELSKDGFHERSKENFEFPLQQQRLSMHSRKENFGGCRREINREIICEIGDDPLGKAVLK